VDFALIFSRSAPTTGHALGEKRIAKVRWSLA